MSMHDTDYGRRVLIKTDDGREAAATFIRWCETSRIVPPSMAKGGHDGGIVREIVALVEMDDGTVAEAPTALYKIVFMDGPAKFDISADPQKQPVSGNVLIDAKKLLEAVVSNQSKEAGE